MALDILTWIFAGGFAVCAVLVVYLIMAYIWPMKTSPAKYFVKAKRERKPLVVLDTGKYFRFVVGEEKVGEEKNQVIRQGLDIVKVPLTGGMKYSEGNVLMGVGEDFRSMVTNIGIIDLMQALNRKGWDTETINRLLEELTKNLKIDLGYIDEGDEIRKEYEKDVATINTQYDAAIKDIKGEVNPDSQEDPQENGVNSQEGEDVDGQAQEGA